MMHGWAGKWARQDCWLVCVLRVEEEEGGKTLCTLRSGVSLLLLCVQVSEE